MIPYFIHSEVEKFIDSLSEGTRSRTDRTLKLLKEYGRLLPPPESKKITRELFELRVRAAVQVRLLYGFSGDMAIIVHGFVKKSKKIPFRELRLAHRRFRELAE